jgi:hypothetical protein
MIQDSTWTALKTIKDTYFFIIYYITDDVNYVCYVGNRYAIYRSIIRPGSDKTDFETNYKADGVSVSCESCAIAGCTSGIFKVFDAEALADGVYEDSTIISCDFAAKTFNIQNTTDLSTGVDLYYRIWGSPDNSDWEALQAETLLAKGAKTSVVNNDMWKYVKISAKGSGGASAISAFIQVGSH